MIPKLGICLNFQFLRSYDLLSVLDGVLKLRGVQLPAHGVVIARIILELQRRADACGVKVFAEDLPVRKPVERERYVSPRYRVG